MKRPSGPRPRRNPFRSPSLFWTFAGSFLLVLVIATLVQGLLVVGIVRPFTARNVEDRAAGTARDVALALAALPDPSPSAVSETLRSWTRESEGPEMIVFRDADLRLTAAFPLPPFLAERLSGVIDGEAPSGGRARVGRPPGPLREPAGRREGPPGGPAGPPGGREDARPDRVLAREAVEAANGLRGEVLVLGRSHPFRLWPQDAPRPLGYFLPVAIVLSGLAGLLLFRAFVRRLRALERHAARVAEGDLEARVGDPRGDEIGRLGDRLDQMTERLAEARRRVEATEAQRSRLLADVSHELATPLTSIRGYAETLADSAVAASPEERSAYLRNILEESGRMEFLIRDLFELARLEGGDQLLRERLDWAALCRNTIDRLQGRARDAGVRIEWVSGDAEAWVDADGRRQERLVENLLVNALRYVPAGGCVRVALDPAPPAGWRLSVADDGPGVSPQDLPHVFDRFYRGDPARSDGGSGLGLAIVREIATRHGGTVSVENAPEGGAVFRVVLPAAGPDSRP